MRKDPVNSKYFIQNKRTSFAIILLLITFFLTCTFIVNNKLKEMDKEREKTLSYFYPRISESLAMEKITAENSTKLRNYFLNNGREEYKTWGQICLFFKFEECINYNATWGLKEEHKYIVESYYNGRLKDLHSLTNGEESTEENRCYVIFYETQNDLDNNKKKFIDNYQSCRKYYLNALPTLVKYEENFLKIFR